MSDPGKPIIWEGPTPDNLEEIEKIVRKDMESDGVNMEIPSKLVFCDVYLTEDYDSGPTVTVWGEKDNDLYFLAKYHTGEES